MKDAFDVVKYIIRKFFFDDDLQHQPIIQQQECSWKKILTSNTDITFRQYYGERLLNLSRTVKTFVNYVEFHCLFRSHFWVLLVWSISVQLVYVDRFN